MASRSAVLREIDRLEPQVRKAFRDAVQGMTSRARINELAAAIDAGDIEAAMRAAGITQGAWTGLTESIRSVYVQSGAFHAADVPSRIRFAFDVNNPRAEAFVREKGAQMVTILQNEQREVVQQVIRDHVERGLARGANPVDTARDLAGRIDKQTGRRVGGKIQLTSQQSQYVSNAAQELRSGSRPMMNNYLSRTRRDRRFDGMVRKAMEAGEGLTEAQVNKLTGRYSDRLLQSRAETIARTETNRAFQEAADESLRQLVEEGHVNRDQIRRVWDATGDMQTRPDHAEAHGQVVGLDEPFTVGGESLMYPLDPAGSPEQTINCRCRVRQEINYITEEAARG